LVKHEKVYENNNNNNTEDDEVIFVTEINTSSSSSSSSSSKSFACSQTTASYVDNAANHRLVSIKQEIKEEFKEHLKVESLIKVDCLNDYSAQAVSVELSSEIAMSNNKVIDVCSPLKSELVHQTESNLNPEETENENRERRKSLKRPLEDNQLEANPNANCSKLSEDEVMLNDYMDKLETSLELNQQTKPNIDYYLVNFTNAIESVLNEPNYSFLLSEYDSQTVERFSQLTRKQRPLPSILLLLSKPLNCLSSFKIKANFCM